MTASITCVDMRARALLVAPTSTGEYASEHFIRNNDEYKAFSLHFHWDSLTVSSEWFLCTMNVNCKESEICIVEMMTEAQNTAEEKGVKHNL